MGFDVEGPNLSCKGFHLLYGIPDERLEFFSGGLKEAEMSPIGEAGMASDPNAFPQAKIDASEGELPRAGMLAATDVGTCRELQQLFVVRKALPDVDVEVNSFHKGILSR